MDIMDQLGFASGYINHLDKELIDLIWKILSGWRTGKANPDDFDLKSEDLIVSAHLFALLCAIQKILLPN
jgi:hypothetical protein